jgi:eukaryotic-like serine/threonine-protein kinase
MIRMLLNPGTMIGRFEVVAPIGAGGMGEVYRARDRRLSREVAVKILGRDLGETPSYLGRFEQEARALAALAHPNVVVVYELDVDAASGVMYIATELLEGESLRARVERGPLSWRSASEIAADIASGLAAAHQKGIVHRDVKPENVFLTSGGVVKVLDFGLARIVEPMSDEELTIPQRTAPGVVMGTISYMSPEQGRGDGVTPASDIFSLGITLFELLTGQRPFDRSTAPETLAAIFRDEPPLEQIHHLPPQLAQIVSRCLAKSPDRRYGSAHDLALDLRSIASSGPTAAAPARETPKIAVLPFENTGGDADTEYLSDGITESIIARLARLPQVRVIARSTVFRYRQSERDPREVGAEVGAELVVTGRVRQQGDRLVIGAELVDVSEGAQLWGERFRRRSADLLEIEEEIAEEITRQLRERLGAEDASRENRRQTDDVEAYRAYLRGRFFWNKRTEAGLHLGLRHFREAIEKDPTYALAWVGVADSWNILGFYSLLAPGESFPRGEAAAQRALEIDPSLAAAHASLAYSIFYHRWEPARSEAIFHRAFEEDEDYPVAHQFYANQLVAMGRFEEGIREFRRALELDPLSLIINSAFGWCFYYQRDFGRAVDQLNRALALDDGFALAHLFLSRVLVATGEMDGAISHAEKAVSLTANQVEPKAALAVARHKRGDSEGADAILAEILRWRGERFVQPYDVAMVHAAAGRKEETLQWLRKAVEIRSHRAVFLDVEPTFEAMRDEEEFRRLVAEVGIAGS